MFAWRDQYLSFNGSGGVTPDPYWAYVSLLENFESPQLAFVDSSSNNFLITVVGDTKPSLQTPFGYGTGGSLYFDGTGDYITAPDNDQFYLDGDFTIECWSYITTATGIKCVMAQWPGVSATNCAWALDIQATNNYLYFAYGIGGTNNYVTSTLAAPINTWNHLAVTRSGTSLRIFVNGVSSTPATLSGALNNSTGEVNIGRKGDNSQYVTGFISNARIVKGTAIYTSDFTPSTSPLPNVAGTSLLVNATNQGLLRDNTFVDSSTTVPANLVVSGTVRYSGSSPYGNQYPGSINFPNSSYLSAVNNIGYRFGTGNFTVEFWLYCNVAWTSQPASLGVVGQKQNDTTNGWVIYRDGTYPSLMNFRLTTTYGFFLTASTPATQTWQHWAVVRNGTTMSWYKNGVLDSTMTIAAGTDVNDTTGGFWIGRAQTWGGYLNGKIANMRIVKGTAVYTSNFTPSTTPLGLVTGTTYLQLSAGGYQDLSPQGQLITNSGSNNQLSNQLTKFGTQSSNYTATGYQQISDSTSLRFGTGDFTIEGWVYVTVLAQNHSIVFKGSASTGWGVALSFGNLQWYSGSSLLKSSTTSIPANTWTYFAITRSGTTAYMFVNGNLEGSSFTDSANYTQTSILNVGANRSNANGITGYIDDLRITTGVCRYTSSFTAPTTAFPTS